MKANKRIIGYITRRFGEDAGDLVYELLNRHFEEAFVIAKFMLM